MPLNSRPATSRRSASSCASAATPSSGGSAGRAGAGAKAGEQEREKKNHLPETQNEHFLLLPLIYFFIWQTLPGHRLPGLRRQDPGRVLKSLSEKSETSFFWNTFIRNIAREVKQSRPVFFLRQFRFAPPYVFAHRARNLTEIEPLGSPVSLGGMFSYKRVNISKLPSPP